MSRCAHRNVTVGEETSTSLCWSFVRGKLDYDWTADNGYTGTTSVECHDCGFHRTYSRRSKRPKWVESYEMKIANRNEVPE